MQSVFVGPIQVHRNQRKFPRLRSIRPGKGKVPPVRRESNVAVDSANHGLRDAAQHGRPVQIEVRVRRIRGFDEIQIVPVGRKSDTLVRSGSRRDHLRVAAGRDIPQPQTLQSVVIHDGQNIASVGRQSRKASFA